MKNILHYQVPIKNGRIDVSSSDLQKFVEFTRKVLGDEYHVIVSPCVPSLLSAENLLNFDIRQINTEELIKILQDTIKE